MLLKNGYLIDPASNTDELMDIRVENGTIVELGKDLSAKDEEEILDLSGLTVAPGLIDTHIHFRDPGLTYKEDLHTGSLAAAKGGFTSVICMANTKPAVDSVDTLKDILIRAQNENIHIYQTASVSYGLSGEKMTDFDALVKAGACGFTDDGIPLLDATFCYKAMQKAAELHMPISLHEEDKAFITNNGINAGEISTQLGVAGSPAIAEEVMVARDCMLALRSGAAVVIQHISSGNSVELVRTEKDRQEIIQGLKDGTIDLIATDHAPHSAEEKAKPLTEAPSGITGLETSLGLGITSLVKEGYLTLMELLEKMTCNPAKLYKLPGGSIQVHAPADFVIFNPDETWTVTDFASKSSNSPFKGAELYGKIHYTICNGKIVYQG